ncbi:MAG: DUF6443 domain-containing protein, partial [Prevotellaceae bacterium]|nr:DUF6443 domain-containing protein [Prevotellaceae bacterium]
MKNVSLKNAELNANEGYPEGAAYSRDAGKNMQAGSLLLTRHRETLCRTALLRPFALSHLRTLSFLLLTLFTFPRLQAGTEEYGKSLCADCDLSVAAGSTLKAYDDIFNVDGEPARLIREQRVSNLITLRVDHSEEPLSEFDATVKFDIHYTNQSGDEEELTGLSLSVGCHADDDGPCTDRSSYRFEGGHSVTVIITEVNETVPGALKLDNIIRVERLYGFDYSAPVFSTFPSGTELNAFGEYTISWSEVPGAEEYQLEWLHINDYNGIGLPYDFSQNATRVTVKNTSCRVSSVFEKGHILFRVRAVTCESLDRKYALPGKWSCEAAGNCSGTNASLYADKITVAGDARHTNDRLNWQYITNYAEEGKKKEVVTYYDGTMRSHQAVTRLNTDNSIVVGETYYDRLGRPAVQALPVPVQAEEGESTPLEFYPGFNKNPDGAAYSRADFDRGEVPCELSADAMLETDGAAKYYSPQNKEIAGGAFDRFIPDAEGYPFSQTEYTADNTGRIKRQGGVGAEYQLGSGHETRYLYSTPDQQELNSLFGGEAGYSNHYKKNTVIDANGQLSVSYMDMYGRVVATALSGAPPSAVEGLDSYQGAKDSVINVLNSLPASEEGSFSIRNTFFHTVTTAAPQKFHYILPDIHFDSEGNLVSDICLDCVYDLTIDVVDECGRRPRLDGAEQLPVTRTVGALDYLCSGASLSEKIAFDFTTEKLEIGTYAISRTLSVNKGALEANTIRYVDSLANIPKLKEIIDAEIARIDLDACKQPDCGQDCLLTLGENPSYEDYMRCKADCEYASECAAMEKILASDFMPGIEMKGDELFVKEKNDGKDQIMGGQYALYELNNGVYSAPDALSIFHTDLDLLYEWWGKPFLEEGIESPSASDKIKALVLNFDTAWAKVLIDRHPEKCKLDACKANEVNGIQQYDYLMSMTETYEEAYLLGLLNPLGLSEAGLPPAAYAQRDPFFKPGGTGEGTFDQMAACMLKDTLYGGGILGKDVYLTMWEKAVLLSGVCESLYREDLQEDLIEGGLSDEQLTYIAEHLDGCLAATTDYALTPLEQAEACSRDRVWTFFRALYRERKEQMKLKNPAQGCREVDPGRKKRFPDNEDLFSENDREIMDSKGSDMTKIKEAQGEAYKEMNEMCALQAKAQLGKIMEELADCRVTGDDSWVWDSTNVKYREVEKAFYHIMHYTCDMTNLFGASDIPLELRASLPDSIKYVSFEEALESILGAENLNPDCNSDLISFPMKSGHELTDWVAYKQLDSCGCATLLEADAEYRTKREHARLPVSILNGRKYFEEEYGFPIDNYQAKICICEREMLNPVNINERLKEYNEFIPRGISCQTCVDCEMIREKLTHFRYTDFLRHTVAADIFDAVANNHIRDVRQQKRIENYLNNELNMNMSYGEYYTFLDGCYRLEYETDAFVCNEQPDIRAERLINVIGSVIKYPIAEQCIDPELNKDVQAAIPGTEDNSCQSYLYDVSLSTDTTLSVTVYDPKKGVASGCPVLLRFTENRALYSYSNIIRFDKSSIRRAPDTQIDEGLFLIDAVIDYRGSLLTVTLQMRACFPVFTCYSGENSGDYTLCPRQQPTPPAPEEECAEILVLTAMKNAERIYETILDSTVTAFRTDYSRQCLTTTGREQLNLAFKANQRQYTLYYYDQAGNLVRTIPPEGVVPVDKNLFVRIDQDRANDTITVFTQHRMETRYLYNSLNQLVYQYMPDHDAFEEISLTGRNGGLPASLNIEALSLAGAHGVLFGTLPGSETQSAGYVTADGGENWIPVTDLGINNLNGLCLIPGTGTVCIAGDAGTLLKSSGTGWITLNTQVREDLVAVHFTNSTTGFFFTVTGRVFKTENGGNNWNPVNGAGLNMTKLENVCFNATEGYAAGYSGNEGVVYRTLNGGESWQREQAAVSDPAYIHAANSQTAYMQDQKGILLKIAFTGSGWEVRPVVSAEHPVFRKMLFTPDSRAVALTPEGYLQASLNGGVTWHTPTGTGGRVYRDIMLAGSNVYLLTGESENQVSVRSSSDGFNAQLNLSGGLHGNFNALCFENLLNGYAGGNGGLLYRLENGAWQQLTPKTAGDEAWTEDITAVYSTPVGMLSPKVHVLTSGNHLYQGEVNGNIVTFAQPLPGETVQSSSFNASGKGYVLTADRDIYTNVPNDGGSWSLAGNIPGATAVALSPDNPYMAFTAGANGEMMTTADAFGHVASQAISLPTLYDVALSGSTAVGAGESGTIIRRSGSGRWDILP